MANDNREKKSAQEKSHWWFAEQLIAGLDASAQIKLLLFLVHLHQNKKSGRAWASQETLGREMALDVSRVKEYFAEARRRGFIGVDRQRKGQQKQFNQYWLNIEQLRACQRPDRHQSEHGSSTPPASTEHGSPASPGHSASAPLAHGSSALPGHGSKPPIPRLASAPEGFELDSVVENSNSKGAVSSPDGSPDEAPALSPEIEAEKEKLVNQFSFMLRDERMENPSSVRVEQWFDEFRKSANALGTDWKEIQTLWKRVLQIAFPAPLPVTPPATPPESERETFRVNRNAIQNLRRHAKERGIDADALKAFVTRNFPVSCLAHLTVFEYHLAMNYLTSLPKVPSPSPTRDSHARADQSEENHDKNQVH